MDFTAQHVGRFLKTQRIASNNLETGMIVYGSYTDRHNESSKAAWLILNPSHKTQTHALALNSISPDKLIALARQTKLLYLLAPRYKKLNMEKLSLSEGARFYNTTLKSQLKRGLSGSYRTLNTKNMKQLLVIDYKWPKDIKILNEGELNEG